jgi:hypothetical protein
VNPELERRLRRFGASVDAAAAAQAARRTTASSDQQAQLADLVSGPIGRPRSRPSRLLAVAAAIIAVVAGAVALAVARSDPSTDLADRPSGAPASPLPGDTVDAAASEGSGADAPTVAPTTIATTTSPASTSTTTTTTPQAAPVTSRPPVCRSYAPHDDYHLEICDSGAAVRLVQQRLQASVDSSLHVDGYFGPATRNAVRTFQQLHGLTVDGQVGPATWAVLVPDAPGTDDDGNGIVDPDEITAG